MSQTYEEEWYQRLKEAPIGILQNVPLLALGIDQICMLRYRKKFEVILVHLYSLNTLGTFISNKANTGLSEKNFVLLHVAEGQGYFANSLES